MDEAFLKALEESLSNVGTDVYWERTIGGRKVWLSPIPFVGQGKVQDALANPALGNNAIIETKRMTLAYAIVGIGTPDGGVIDLRPHRAGEQAFTILDPRLGKPVKVDLPTYIHSRMVEWGFQWISDAFDVWADLMESHQRENVKDVKFENAKNPLVELAELEERVRVLREQLGRPPLVEAKPEPERDEDSDAWSKAEAESKPPPVQDFDPFKPIPPAPAQVPQAARPPAPKPDVTVPIPIPPATAARARELAETEAELPAVPLQARPQKPSAPAIIANAIAQAVPPDDVIEHPTSRLVSEPPTVDRIAQSINPRFAPQGR